MRRLATAVFSAPLLCMTSQLLARQAPPVKSARSTYPHTKRDAHTFTFKPHIDARKDVKVTYRVRVKWC